MTFRLSILLLSLLLGAGSTMRGAPVQLRPMQPELAAFAFNGRVATRHNGERTSAGVRWTHRGAEDEILLLAPFGQTAARIFSDASGVLLEASGKEYFEQDAETLLNIVIAGQGGNKIMNINLQNEQNLDLHRKYTSTSKNCY